MNSLIQKCPLEKNSWLEEELQAKGYGQQSPEAGSYSVPKRQGDGWTQEEWQAWG